jgi:hypothetical protein
MYRGLYYAREGWLSQGASSPPSKLSVIHPFYPHHSIEDMIQDHSAQMKSAFDSRPKKYTRSIRTTQVTGFMGK